MMRYYFDITILPDGENGLGFLWQKVYQQIHLALVENKSARGESEIAVSFPEYGNKAFPLGRKLRLVAPTSESLQKLNIGKWLNRLTDYSHCTSIKEVPNSTTKFVCFKRRQFDTSIERLARRRAKRKGESPEQAMQFYSAFKGESSKLPFINVISLSSDKGIQYPDKDKFRLFIESTVLEESIDGSFSCYGLSQTATVPWF